MYLALWALLIPGLVEVLGSHEPVTVIPGAHYSALLTGYALAAFVDGASRVRPQKPQLFKALIVAAAAASVVVSLSPARWSTGTTFTGDPIRTTHCSSKRCCDYRNARRSGQKTKSSRISLSIKRIDRFFRSALVRLRSYALFGALA